MNRKKTLSVYWKNKANDYHAAAIVLEEQININNSYQIKSLLGNNFDLRISLRHIFSYLSAVSIELNIKACIIQKLFNEEVAKMFSKDGKNTISENDIFFSLDKEFYTHDLCKLAGIAHINFLESEKNLLELFTHVLYWNSKYPIPKSQGVTDKYSMLFNNHILLPIPPNSKLKPRTINPEMIINLKNYLKIWEKTEKHYETINI